MKAYRICKRRYADRKSMLVGAGAKEIGGRWNRVGLALVYASENRSLAMLELLARCDVEDLAGGLVVVEIIIPDDASVERIEVTALPPNWREPSKAVCAQRGSEWIECRASLVLRVPSATNFYENHVLLNPLHPDIARCKVGSAAPVSYDPRIEPLFTEDRRHRAGAAGEKPRRANQ